MKKSFPSIPDARLSLASVLLTIVLLVVLVSLAYQRTLHGPFVFDDQINILENPAVKLQTLTPDALQKALLSNESGVFKRILPALSFGLNYYQAQGFANTLVFKLTNLSIHLVNAVLVFGLMLQLAPKLVRPSTSSLTPTQTVALAFFIAWFWAIHPLHVSTVAYIVQRMTSMATVFMLLGLNGYVWSRNRLALGKRFALAGMGLALVLGTALGLLCKENAALLILYTAAIDFCLYTPHAGTNKKVIGLYAVLLGIPACIGLVLMLTGHFNPLAGFATRPFTLEQRLLTEARVLWFYLQMLVFPDVRVMGLYHDDLPLSKNWLEPISTLVSVIAWAGMLVLVWVCRRKLPLVSFAIVWFLVGHSMESSILPLEIIFEHRNYLPSLGILMVVAGGIVALSQRFSAHPQTVATVVLTFTGLLLSGLTLQRASYWESEASLFKSIATNHPESPISLYSYAELLNKKNNQPTEAYAYYLKAVSLNKESASLKMQATLSAEAQTAVDPLLNPQALLSQLNTRALTPWDLTVLDDAARCVISKFQRCTEHFADVQQWLKAAIDNRFLSQEWRRTYVNSLFAIEMHYGQPQAALQTVTTAQAQDPRVFQYYLMKADALLATGQQAAALALVTEAEQLAQRYNPNLLNDVYRLKSKILQQR